MKLKYIVVLMSVFLLSSCKIVGAWEEITSDTYWTPAWVCTPTWNGSAWTSGEEQMTCLNLQAIGTWENGYRPTKIRFTFTGTMVVDIYDTEMNSIGIGGSGITSGTEYDLTIVGYDLLGFASTGEAILSKIEFYIPITLNGGVTISGGTVR
jgi:hypothetical protein